jgi:hypothetical protein
MSEGLKKTEQLTVISKSQLDKHFMDSMWLNIAILRDIYYRYSQFTHEKFAQVM